MADPSWARRDLGFSARLLFAARQALLTTPSPNHTTPPQGTRSLLGALSPSPRSPRTASLFVTQASQVMTKMSHLCRVSVSQKNLLQINIIHDKRTHFR